MMKYILNIIALTFALSALGQELKISLDKEEILIGQPFTLTYTLISEVKIDSLIYYDSETLFSAKNTSTAKDEGINAPYELEILSPFKDTTYKEGNQFVWKGSYTLTGWDSAYVVIPPEIIYINDSIQLFPAGLIHIVSPSTDPTKPIFDINEAFTELPEDESQFFSFLKNYWWWIGFIAGALIILMLYLFKRKRKKPEVLSLRQETLKKIDLLEKSKGYESNLKEYYFELSIILRRFFEGHYQERILDKTTGEIEVFLSNHGLDQPMILLTRQLLTQSDLVKFAQSKPSLVEIQSVTNKARKVVNEIADLELKNE